MIYTEGSLDVARSPRHWWELVKGENQEQTGAGPACDRASGHKPHLLSPTRSAPDLWGWEVEGTGFEQRFVPWFGPYYHHVAVLAIAMAHEQPGAQGQSQPHMKAELAAAYAEYFRITRKSLVQPPAPDPGPITVSNASPLLSFSN